MMAAGGGHAKAVISLLKAGANIDLVDNVSMLCIDDQSRAEQSSRLLITSRHLPLLFPSSCSFANVSSSLYPVVFSKFLSKNGLKFSKECFD